MMCRNNSLALQERYGKDILQTLWKEAERRYHAAEAKKKS
jgi:hypothetical protein